MSTSRPFAPNIAESLLLPAQGSWPETRHRFDERSVCAVNAAIAAGRPLLLRGEPGIGKSQLARAVAVAAEVPFLPFVVDERTERDELFYSFDAVARLAQAQVSALIAQENKANQEKLDWRLQLSEENFFRPSVLWWAFNWNDASRQAELFLRHSRGCQIHQKPSDWSPTADRSACGPVVLIDEIDKADPTVPNGLLECLGNKGFQTAQLGKSISLAAGAKQPLVIITTNEDRELPAAFLRRCLVLRMPFPRDVEAAERFLIEDRARVLWKEQEVSDAVCRRVVSILLSERENLRQGSAVPGAAEFLDILRVLVEFASGDDKEQLSTLETISDFALIKNRDEP